MSGYPVFRRQNVPAYLAVMACWFVVAVAAAWGLRVEASAVPFGIALIWSLVVVMAGMGIMFGASLINLRRLGPGFQRLAEGQADPGIPPVWCPVLTAATNASLQLAMRLRAEAGATADKPEAAQDEGKLQLSPGSATGRVTMGDESGSRSSARMHISVYVADMERSAAFYEALFGVPAHKARPGYAEFDLHEPALRLVLQEVAPQGPGTVNHLGLHFAAAQQLEAARERLAAAGCKTRDVPDATCGLAGCHPRQGTLWVNAPEATRWELYHETPEARGTDENPKET
jgi:catechol 2,3-dioxygenase-like lactoylglutathione lyase family enzyme